MQREAGQVGELQQEPAVAEILAGRRLAPPSPDTTTDVAAS